MRIRIFSPRHILFAADRLDWVETVLWFVVLWSVISQVALAQKQPSNPKPAEVPLSNLVEKHFAHWDRDHNDVLDLSEVDHVLSDHSVHGRQAALIVCLRHKISDKDHPSTLPHKQLLKLVDEKEFAKSVAQKMKLLETIDRELFLATDPDLATFNQGHLNDCYLLSVIAAQAPRNPKAIREMIHTQVTGGFHVVYGDGQKIEVSPLTEAELLLGAKLDHRHGSWLAVLEKSYGIIRKRERTKKGEKTVTFEPIENLNFGDCGVIISLVTGRHADSLEMKKSHPDQVHNVLVQMTKKKHLLCAGTNNDKAPPGIVNNHVYAVLGYDARNRHLNVFNPWGNNFTPKGEPGKANGYATKNGVFTISLDQFHTVFSDLVYETDRPLKK